VVVHSAANAAEAVPKDEAGRRFRRFAAGSSGRWTKGPPQRRCSFSSRVVARKWAQGDAAPAWSLSFLIAKLMR